jgi:hypothetical protein
MKTGRLLLVGAAVVGVAAIGYAAYKGSKGQPVFKGAGFAFEGKNASSPQAPKYNAGYQAGNGFADNSRDVNSSVNDVRADIQTGTAAVKQVGTIIQMFQTKDDSDGTGLDYADPYANFTV